MKVFERFFCLLLVILFLSGCQTSESIKEVDPTLDPVVSYDLDTMARPTVTDSIHLWIVPNHMLWIPLEFEDPHYHYKDSRIEVR